MLDRVSCFIKVSSLTGWEMTTLYSSKTMQPQEDQFDKSHQISINDTKVAKVLNPPYYWSAPKSYLGNKVSSLEEMCFFQCSVYVSSFLYCIFTLLCIQCNV